MSGRGWLAGILAALLAVIGGTVYVANRPHPKPHPSPSPSVIPSESPSPVGGCRMRASVLSAGELVLPDPVCTPGALNPAVTAATIASTICKTGWTTTIRPPVSYTAPLKVQGMKAYGFVDAVSAHEEDHMVPLELGGAARDPHNLWPEPGATPNRKDLVENHLRAQVCNRSVQLAAAQQAIESDWFAVWVSMGRPAPGPTPRSSP